MIIEDLIAGLQAIQKNNPGIRVCTYDWKQNIHHGTSNGTPIGIHDFTSVTLISGDNKPDSSIDWVALDHDNHTDYDEDGKRL